MGKAYLLRFSCHLDGLVKERPRRTVVHHWQQSLYNAAQILREPSTVKLLDFENAIDDGFQEATLHYTQRIIS